MSFAMRWDLWEAVGLLGELFFFARLIAQGLASEKAGRPVLPRSYWFISMAGAVIMGFYALHLGSFAILLPQIIGLAIYARGLQLDRRQSLARARREKLGLDRPDYPWPGLSVIVPVHNEEKTLAKTLEAILSQAPAGGGFETIVALNGCHDASLAVAEKFPVRIVEDGRAGIGYGKNLGAGAARGEELVFVDADTVLPPGSLQLLREAAAGRKDYVGTVPGRPDRGGLVVRICFRLANFLTRRRRAHAPGGVMLMARETFNRIGGYDEKMPTSTSTDLIWRALRTGAEYVFVDAFKAQTSIRRFEKTGIIRQMLDWRSNHMALLENRRDRILDKHYESYR
jgi:lipid-A-disaccharide synthase-like uncharacterized protein